MAIDCETAFELLLEADPTELAGRGDSELAEHVRGCARCGAVAARLLRGQEELATALGELGPRTGVEEALSIVRARRRKVEWRRHAWRVVAPLAAAAAIAAVVILRSPTEPLPEEIVRSPAPRIEAVVKVAAAQNVMVFETRDKSAKVIWFY